MFDLATKFTPVEPAFQMAERAGFRAAEFYLSPEILAEPDKILAAAQQYPFRYAMHFPNHGPITDQMLQSVASLYSQLNCTALVMHQPMFNRHASALLKLNPQLDLAIENHIFGWDGFLNWAEQSPGLTLDVEHLWKFTLQDAPITDLLDKLEYFLVHFSSKLQHVHLLGYVPGGDEHRPVHHHPELTTAAMTKFREHGFSKLVVSEADLIHQNEESLARDVEFFQSWLKQSSQS